jgi:hypothetical protein
MDAQAFAPVLARHKDATVFLPVNVNSLRGMNDIHFLVGGSVTRQRFVIEDPASGWFVEALRGPRCKDCNRDLHIRWDTPPRQGLATSYCAPGESRLVQLHPDQA